jgi:hypothetical protein
MADKKKALPTFRVYVAQVNQTMVKVQARSAEEASEKGYAKWRREQAHSWVCSVELEQGSRVEQGGGK